MYHQKYNEHNPVFPQQEHFPVTIVYVENLEFLGYFDQYVKSEIYIVNMYQKTEYLLSSRPNGGQEKQCHNLETSILRLVFATIALWMGLDVK